MYVCVPRITNTLFREEKNDGKKYGDSSKRNSDQAHISQGIFYANNYTNYIFITLNNIFL